MLNAYFNKGEPLYLSRTKLISHINQIVDYAHKNNIPIIWIRQEYKRDLSDAPLYNKKNNKLPKTLKNDQSSRILDELHKLDYDKIVVKKRYSAFFKTKLDRLLKKLNVNTLIIAGINSMTCVRTTVNDAYQRDYEVILALDCINGYDKKHHINSIKYMQYSQSTGMNNAEIIEEIKKSKRLSFKE